jgi:lipopolysaccharide/colanic/teichoic acid biosynthesis glycosyltransferase
MAYSQAKRIEMWLRAADVALLLGWCVLAYFLPENLQTTLAWIMGVAWYAGIMTVGGQNSTYLHPRYRILVSMGLALLFATLMGIFWAGSGREWYLKGGAHFLVALGIAGTVIRLLLAHFLQRPAIQLVPFQVPALLQSLLDELAGHPHVYCEVPLAGASADLPERRSRYPIYLVVGDLRLREADVAGLMPLYARVEIVDLCELYESLLGKVAMVATPAGWVLPQALRMPSPVRETLKRAFDVLLVLLTAPVWLPVIGGLALLVKATSAGPAFFSQERLGRYGVPFRILKLRTMGVDAEVAGKRWAGADDPRVTPIGRWLRKSGLDELPQLWNILRGEMSLIGPRPETPEIAARLAREIPFYGARLLATPGIAGWAQLHQGGDATVEDVGAKVRYDLYYLKYGAFLMDLRILLGTLQMLLHLAKPTPTTAAKTPTASA